MNADSEADRRLLAELRQRRAELRGSMSAVEHALASPAVADGRRWAEGVRAALAELSSDLRAHIEITEGADGLYRELQRQAPRLTGLVERLTREHDEMARRLEDLFSVVDAADGSPDVDRIRRMGTELVAALMHHRQRGADLVFEAYEADIGGET